MLPNTARAEVANTLESTTVWSFPRRGDWATHRGDYPGNWPPQVPRNLILRYTREGDTVIDPMCGSGTTLVECRVLGRNGIGIDVNERAVAVARDRLRFPRPAGTPKAWQRVIRGDARKTSLPTDSAALVALHPPYHNIVRYSDPPLPSDISHAPTEDDFLAAMESIAGEVFRIVTPGGHVGLLMGDMRRNGEYVPLAYRALDPFIRAGFQIRENAVKVQWNCRSDARWRDIAQERGFLMIAHEHLFVLRKPLAG